MIRPSKVRRRDRKQTTKEEGYYYEDVMFICVKFVLKKLVRKVFFGINYQNK